DQSARDLGPVVPRELADRVGCVGVPRQRDRSGRQVVLTRNVKERGEQRSLGDLAGGDELRDRIRLESQVPDLGSVLQVNVRQRAVGGAEIDADEITHVRPAVPVSGPGARNRYSIAMPADAIGLDVGGANLKAATVRGRARTR